MNTNEDYWKFSELEQRFNEIQAGIRNLASTWMLGAFAAIAVLFNPRIRAAGWYGEPSQFARRKDCVEKKEFS